MEKHLKKFFELSLDLFCIADPKGHFVDLNPAFSRTLGWSREELLSRSFWDLIHPDDHQKTAEEIAKLRQGLPALAFENRFRSVGGEYRHLVWNVFPEPGSELLFAAARDVTDKKLSDSKLRETAASLQRRIMQLNELIDTGIDIIRIDQTESLVDLALRRATALTDASRGMVHIKKPDGSMEQIAFPEEGSPESEGDADIIQSGFEAVGSQYTFMVIGKENHQPHARFETVDKMLLHLISQQVRTALENRYFLNEMLEKQRMTREIELASTIQKTILPSILPVIPGYHSSGLNIPSREVGGDYYEIIPLSDGRNALVIADVAGKGIYSALLVNSLHAALHAYLESGIPLEAMALRLNQLMFDVTTAMLFTTCFVALLDPVDGRVEYMNAGHLPPKLIRRDGRIDIPNEGGPPLGCLREGVRYTSGAFTLQRGDGLLLYTDGVTEAVNPAGEFYQNSGRFEALLRQLARKERECELQEIVTDVREFTQAESFEDDITLLYLRREG
ncbi:MAG TPA: SpoIIE family protein phosphatase [bacterium]|nr:SpoIIE family protein phosphatase [bacterium]HPR86945.1 SpoIIE family protein phosphatase [bacterium]